MAGSGTQIFQDQNPGLRGEQSLLAGYWACAIALQRSPMKLTPVEDIRKALWGGLLQKSHKIIWENLNGIAGEVNNFHKILESL